MMLQLMFAGRERVCRLKLNGKKLPAVRMGVGGPGEIDGSPVYATVVNVWLRYENFVEEKIGINGSIMFG